MKQERNLTADEKKEIATELAAMSEARLVFTGEGFKATFNGAFLAMERDTNRNLWLYDPSKTRHTFAVNATDLKQILKLDVDACTGIELVYPEGSKKMSRRDVLGWLLDLLHLSGREKEVETVRKYWERLPEAYRYDVEMEAIN